MESNKDLTVLWQAFQEREQLSDSALEQFKTYCGLIQEWNEKINLTSITRTESIIRDHFSDSLALAHYVDLKNKQSLVDVGTGAGLPGIPLKIMYPHLQVLLIEVTQKKVLFLEQVITTLKLTGIHVVSLDWRTFLRTSKQPADIFVSRAALQPEELLRVFKPSLSYQQADLVYWAASDWKPSEVCSQYIHHEYPYALDHKKRKLVHFRAQSSALDSARATHPVKPAE